MLNGFSVDNTNLLVLLISGYLDDSHSVALISSLRQNQLWLSTQDKALEIVQ